jgi:ubiquinone/menaquinone biosynthesis C-methylase UbiE
MIKDLRNIAGYSALASRWQEYVKVPDRRKSHEFYVRIAQENNTQMALDIGGGVGDHAIEMKKAGVDMHVCDASEKMLEEAGKNAKKAGVHIERTIADWKELERTYAQGKFDMVMQTMNSIALNLTGGDLETMVRGVHNVLRERGMFAFDMRNYGGMELEKESRPLIDNDAFYVEAELMKNGLVGLMTYPKTGNRKRVIQAVYPWKPEQIAEALDSAGFQRIATYHDFGKEEKKIEETPDSVSHIQIVASKDAR